jgi:hypothetical protein
MKEHNQPRPRTVLRREVIHSCGSEISHVVLTLRPNFRTSPLPEDSLDDTFTLASASKGKRKNVM